jgi:hypothetical protein
MNINNFLHFDGQDNYVPYLDDSRYRFPNDSPINPNFKDITLTSSIVPSGDLYTGILNQPTGPLNELIYSGGNTKLVRIPLQMNAPNSTEMLRSQSILITPYNKVKYSNECI